VVVNCQSFFVVNYKQFNCFWWVYIRAYVHNGCLSFARTVVGLRECWIGDEASQWKRPKFDQSPRQNSLTDLHIFIKIGTRDYSMDANRHAKLCSHRFRGFLSTNTWICHAFDATSFYVRFGGSSIRPEPTPLNGFLRKKRQMTSFQARKCLRPLNFRNTAILGTNFDDYLRPAKLLD